MKINLLLFSIIFFLAFSACKKKESPVPSAQHSNSVSEQQQPDTSVFLTYFSGTRAYNEPIVDQNESVWIQSDGGLGGVSKDGITNRFPVPPDFAYCNAFDMVVDSHNNKWLCGRNGDLYKFDGVSFTKINKNFGAAIQQKLCIDSQDNLWIGNEYGLYKYDGSTVQHWPWNINVYSVSAMTFDNLGNLWVGCYEGLLKFDGNNFTLYKHGNNAVGSESVGCIAFDTKGKLWVGYAAYLSSFENGVWTHHRCFMDGNQPRGLSAINFDANDIMWIGTQKGLTWFDGTVYTDEPTLKGYSIRGGSVDSQGNFWYSTDDGHGLIKVKAK
ncbi:MAG: hypothetical protein IPG89_19810 [Bacteroidetes bacterium]|nr:hypothetical protein [Bacteroidota bacterium]